MAGTYTQKRDLSRRASIGGVDYIGQPFGTNYPLSVHPSFQTTTSYRSGGRFESETGDNTVSQELFIANQGQFARPYDTGHEFFTSKTFTVHSCNEGFLRGLNGSFYRGPITLDGSSGGFRTVVPRDLTVYGTTAIKNTRPDKPRSQTLTGLIELVKEGIPAMVGFANYQAGKRLYGNGNVIDKAGSEWLNFQFGLEALAGAILDTAAAVMEGDKILKQYLRDSSKVVRRRMEFDPIITTEPPFIGSATVNGFLTSPTRFADSFQMGWNSVTVTRTSVETLWFSGAYQYYIEKFSNDPLDELEFYRKKAKKLFNMELTPEVIYSVTPWSWLLDWFFNFGDLLANADSFNQNNVLLRYGYMMRQTVMHNTLSAPDITFTGKKFGGISSSFITIQKERVRSTPFGFGLNPNAFTPGQWTILAALGMTKGANKLR